MGAPRQRFENLLLLQVVEEKAIEVAHLSLFSRVASIKGQLDGHHASGPHVCWRIGRDSSKLLYILGAGFLRTVLLDDSTRLHLGKSGCKLGSDQRDRDRKPDDRRIDRRKGAARHMSNGSANLASAMA